jgi:hypothetical protein
LLFFSSTCLFLPCFLLIFVLGHPRNSNRPRREKREGVRERERERERERRRRGFLAIIKGEEPVARRNSVSGLRAR